MYSIAYRTNLLFLFVAEFSENHITQILKAEDLGGNPDLGDPHANVDFKPLLLIFPASAPELEAVMGHEGVQLLDTELVKSPP